ncbi:MAG: hypothetical protein A2Y84_00725 [Candidatus Colwellbacteria bacterium RBG_13_48_8]|uniref:Uncharacterized protein n=1 Tax=Candidatus Colwellbacteria bacterium RBG_13_48_8 TaxID=1797685 RepID=A0A1G1YZ94_9BACT|nr:MAG: hypothetical protein A2Y84_00725 [Candidatus Colwellbacteria bacterium RBG_13_48_8]
MGGVVKSANRRSETKIMKNKEVWVPDILTIWSPCGIRRVFFECIPLSGISELNGLLSVDIPDHRRGVAMIKISLNIEGGVYRGLINLARSGEIPSVSGFIRHGITLQRLRFEAERRGAKLLVREPDGTTRELVFVES